MLSKLQSQLGFTGKIILIGTPAEETVGAKIDLAAAGAFSDLDAVFQAHLGDRNDLTANIQALDSIEFHFKGKASHAAASPFEGINALDAVQLLFAGIGALRQQLHPDYRVHGIIIDGGRVTNIIPEHAACQITTRCPKRADLQVLTEKIINIAKGAALMTGAELSYHFFENHFDNYVPVPALVQLTKGHLEEFGFDPIISDGSSPVCGSTDLGNVSYVCRRSISRSPSRRRRLRIFTRPVFCRMWMAAPAYEKLHAVVKGFASAALELFETPSLAQEIKAWHQQNVHK